MDVTDKKGGLKWNIWVVYDFRHFETLGRGRVSSQADPSAFADTKTLQCQHQLVQIAKQIFEDSGVEQIFQYV